MNRGLRAGFAVAAWGGRGQASHPMAWRRAKKLGTVLCEGGFMPPDRARIEGPQVWLGKALSDREAT